MFLLSKVITQVLKNISGFNQLYTNINLKDSELNASLLILIFEE